LYSSGSLGARTPYLASTAAEEAARIGLEHASSQHCSCFPGEDAGHNSFALFSSIHKVGSVVSGARRGHVPPLKTWNDVQGRQAVVVRVRFTEDTCRLSVRSSAM